MDEAIAAAAPPRYLVTDRGGQFQRAFRNRMRARGVEHARGPAGAWPFNAKVERLFWSLKRWWRVSLLVPNMKSIQRRLDAYTTWHNVHRPHASLGSLTPSEASLGMCTAETARYTKGGELEPEIKVRRQHVRGDPRLLYPVIEVTPKKRSAA